MLNPSSWVKPCGNQPNRSTKCSFLCAPCQAHTDSPRRYWPSSLDGYLNSPCFCQCRYQPSLPYHVTVGHWSYYRYFQIFHSRCFISVYNIFWMENVLWALKPSYLESSLEFIMSQSKETRVTLAKWRISQRRRFKWVQKVAISLLSSVRMDKKFCLATPPVLLPGESHGWRSLVGCSPWGR